MNILLEYSLVFRVELLQRFHYKASDLFVHVSVEPQTLLQNLHY